MYGYMSARKVRTERCADKFQILAEQRLILFDERKHEQPLPSRGNGCGFKSMLSLIESGGP